MAEHVDFDQVLSRYERKVEILAHKYLKGTTASMELDDLRQEARLALWFAWQRDPQMGRGFSALAERIIWRKLYDYRMQKRLIRVPYERYRKMTPDERRQFRPLSYDRLLEQLTT